MENTIQLVFTTVTSIICSLLASSGLWSYMSKKQDKKDGEIDLVLGLGHDRILELALTYIERGYITPEEHENLYVYLYEPYLKKNGNGSVKRIMENKVDKLEVRNHKS